MRKFNLLYKLLGLIYFCNLTLTAQVRKYEKLEKIGRNTYNFFQKDKNGKQKKDKSLYVVYSDQQDNICYLDELGLRQAEKQNFLASYYVINEKDDYLELVVKDPTVIGKPKGLFSFFYGSKYRFKDSKMVAYVGWIHKDNLLLYSTPKISLTNYKPVQFMLGFSDLKTFFELNKYVKKDSVNVFKDPKFKIKSDKSLNTNQMVYVFKYNKNKTAALVSNIDNLNLTDSAKRRMGWVPASLVTPIGQREVLYTDLGDKIKLYPDITKDSVLGQEIAKKVVFKNLDLEEKKADSIYNYTLPLHVWNHYDNKLINVKGDDLLIRKITTISKDNKTVNFHFVFDCSQKVKNKLLLQITSLQRIWLMLSEDPRFKGLEVNFTVSSYGCNQFYSLKKTDSFAVWIDYLQNVLLDNVDITKPNIEGITECFEFILDNSKSAPSFENNIILVVGEKEMPLPSINNAKTAKLLSKLGSISSRVLFYQLESSTDDKHQNFVLQSKRILDTIGNYYSDFLKDYTVENRLVKSKNLFARVVTEEDNVYLYDAPKNSLYTGGIVFPKINKSLTPVTFDIALDSLISKTFSFNTEFLESLQRNAAELGFLRSKLTNRFTNVIEQDSLYEDLLSLVPRNQVYEQFLEKGRLQLKDNDSLKEGFLLNKNELNDLVQSYQSIIPVLDTVVKRKSRTKLERIYKKTAHGINKVLFYKELKKRNTLADFIYIKSGFPVSNKLLNTIRIKDTNRKSKISNEEFRDLMFELRRKIDYLDSIQNQPPIIYKDTNQEEYYFISKEYLL